MDLKTNYIGKYFIKKTIGQGSEAKVKLAVKNDDQFAAKIYYGYHTERKSQLRLMKEVEILKKLKGHPHIIEYIEDYTNTIFEKKNGIQFQTDCIILEYCENGSLFEWVEGTGPFSENFARQIFRQLICAISYMHSQQVFHLDLKPENILFKDNFTLKITDFGMAKDVSGQDKELFLNQFLHTTVYHAPEILERKSYNPSAVDVFAAGVILFIILTGHLPFNDANIHTIQDKYYKLIFNKDYTQFWQLHSKNKGKMQFFSESLRDLLEKIFEYDPEKRIQIQDILQHPWIVQNTLTKNEFEEEQQRRNSYFQDYLEEVRIEKMHQKPNKYIKEKINPYNNYQT